MTECRYIPPVDYKTAMTLAKEMGLNNTVHRVEDGFRPGLTERAFDEQVKFINRSSLKPNRINQIVEEYCNDRLSSRA